MEQIRKVSPTVCRPPRHPPELLKHDSLTEHVPALREACEQDDNVTSYGWNVYDPRVGGSQTIRDQDLGIDLTTEFVKNDDGSAWAVRVSGAVRPDAIADAVNTTLVFYIASEGVFPSATKTLSCERLPGGSGHINGASCSGKDPELGALRPAHQC